MERYSFGKSGAVLGSEEQGIAFKASSIDISSRRSLEFRRAVKSVNEGNITPAMLNYLLRKIREGATVSFSPSPAEDRQKPFA